MIIAFLKRIDTMYIVPSITRNEAGFDNQLLEMRRKIFEILWRQDWFAIEVFKNTIKNTYNFSDKARFEELKRAGLLTIFKGMGRHFVVIRSQTT